MSNNPFVRQGAPGRVNADRLYAFNATLKKEAIKPKGYWELWNDVTPVHRLQFRGWQKEKEKELFLATKEANMPADRRFQLKRIMTFKNFGGAVPIIFVGYFVWSWAKYRFWGSTPVESSAHMLRTLGNMPRMPKLS